MHDYDRYAYGVPDEGKPDNWDWRITLPEVYNLQPEHSTEMTQSVQELCFRLFRYGAPNMSLDDAKKKYRVIYQDDTAFCNRLGYPHKTDVPRRDYISGLDLDAENPYLDKPRVCGGALISGTEVGDNLLVDTIDANNIPTMEYIIDNHLYYTAVSVGANQATEFPQGLGEPVFIPLITKLPVEYPLNKLIKLEPDYDASTHNPYRYNA